MDGVPVEKPGVLAADEGPASSSLAIFDKLVVLLFTLRVRKALELFLKGWSGNGCDGEG